MSLLSNLIEEFERESNNPLVIPYYGNDFGLGISPHMFQHQHHHRKPANIITNSLPMGLLNRLQQHPVCQRGDKNVERLTQVGKEGFQASMDVAQFTPSELTVKVVDKCIVIEGKHEEREDHHGYIQRHFVRRYMLPKDYDTDKVVSTLSSDGILTVSVSRPQIEDKSSVRMIQIQQVGPAHLNVKPITQDKDKATNGTVGDEKRSEEIK